METVLSRKALGTRLPPGYFTRAAILRDRFGSSLLLLPAALYLLMFFAYPLVKNVVMGMQDYTTSTFYTGEAPWVGFENYGAVIGSSQFGNFLLNTFVFVAGSLAGQFVLGLAFAIFFNRNFPLNGVLRSLLLLPWLLPIVVSGTVWRWIFDVDNGAANQLMDVFGVAGVPWLVSTQTAMIAVLLVNIWIGIPFNMVILYGGLKEIPSELYEAGRLDGAGPWQLFRHITLPMLRPVVAVVLVLHALAYPKETPKKQQRDALPACVECVVGREGWGGNEWVCLSAWIT